MSSSNELEKAKIYLQLALRTEDRIQQAKQRLHDKVKDAFTLNSALIPVVAALGYFIAKETEAYWILLPTFLSLLMFLIAIIQLIWLNRPTGYQYVDPTPIMEELSKESSVNVISRSAATLCDAANDNVSIINRKENGLNVTYGLVAFGLGILAISFLLFALSYFF